MYPTPLDFTNFFTDYIFYPEHAKPEDQDKCFYISLALGILSLGTIHAVVGIAWGISHIFTCLIGAHSEQDVKIQNVASDNEIIKNKQNDNVNTGKDKIVYQTQEIQIEANRTVDEQFNELLSPFNGFFLEHPKLKVTFTYFSSDLAQESEKISTIVRKTNDVYSIIERGIEKYNWKKFNLLVEAPADVINKDKLDLPTVVLKTPVGEIRLSKINPFRIDYQNRTAEQQAQEILKYFEDFFSEVPNGKIAITYSSNSDQALSIYDGYKTGNYSIKGANQAQVFSKIIDAIKKNNWQNVVHILPIPTCLHSGGAEISTNEDIILAMRNIAQHLNDGWCVLGLQNQLTKPDFPFAIGGGVASKVWQRGTKQREICETYMLRMLNGDVPTEEELDLLSKNSNLQ